MDMNLSKLLQTVEERGARQAAAHEVTRVWHYLAAEQAVTIPNTSYTLFHLILRFLGLNHLILWPLMWVLLCSFYRRWTHGSLGKQVPKRKKKKKARIKQVSKTTWKISLKNIFILGLGCENIANGPDLGVVTLSIWFREYWRSFKTFRVPMFNTGTQ